MRTNTVFGKLAVAVNEQYGRIGDMNKFVESSQKVITHDMILKDVKVSVNGCLAVQGVSDNGVKYDNLKVTGMGLRSLCVYLGIPFSYIVRISESLALLNVESLLNERMAGGMVKVFTLQEDGEKYVVGFTNPEYEPVRLSSIIQLIERSEILRFKEARVSDCAVDVDLVVSEQLQDMQKDEYSYGVSMVISEPGFYPTFMVRPYFMRMMCTNGIVVPIRVGGFKRGRFSADTALNVLQSFVEDRDRFQNMLGGLDRPLKKGELYEGAVLVKKVNKDLISSKCGISYEEFLKLVHDTKEYKHGEEVQKPTRKELFNNMSELGRDIKEVELAREFRVFAGKLIQMN